MKNSKKLFVSFLLVLSLLSCSSQNNNLFQIDPRAMVENKITLADIADEIKYVPLDNSIPFINFKYLITPGFIYISAKGIVILKFDRQGRLSKKIGSQGRGPGEFMFGINFTVDEKTGNVYVVDHTNTIKVYSQNGAFLRDILLNEIGDGIGWGSDIEIYNSLLFFPNTLGLGNSKFSWAFLDTLGNLITSKRNSVPSFQTNAGREAHFYKFNNKLFYYNFYNDTIFSISPDLSNNAAYLFARGDHRWPRAMIEGNSPTQIQYQIVKLFQPLEMFETKRFIVLNYGYQQKFAISFIEKRTKKTYLALKYDGSEGIVKSSGCIINDLDGGKPLENLKYYFENDEEYFSTLISPFNLKRYISTNEFIKSTPKYPEKKKELETLANSLKETDNPVLIIVKLKK